MCPVKLVPRVSSRYDGLGVGFAPYLQPPDAELVRLTVWEPGFDTPDEVIEKTISALKDGEPKYLSLKHI